jgi:3-oxoacyl-[acyl-carrier-protein] synthase-3
MRTVGIRALGIYEPEKVICIQNIKAQENIKDEVIDYLDIKEVREANENEQPCDMAVIAARRAIEAGKINAGEIDIVIYTNTFLPEYQMWADFAYIQERLNIKKAYSIKINQECNSQMVALDYARAKLLTDQNLKNILIVSAERWDKNYVNRFISAGSCFYGDGASAAIVSADVKDLKIIDMNFFTDGSYAGLHYIPVGGTISVPNHTNIDEQGYRFEPRMTCKKHLETKSAKNAFWNAIIDNNIKLINRIMEKHDLKSSQIKAVITYNMGRAVVQKLCEGLGKSLGESSFYIAQRHGHIGSADVCFNLAKMIQDKKVEHDDYIVILSAGFGFSWGAGIIRI